MEFHASARSYHPPGLENQEFYIPPQYYYPHHVLNQPFAPCPPPQGPVPPPPPPGPPASHGAVASHSACGVGAVGADAASHASHCHITAAAAAAACNHYQAVAAAAAAAAVSAHHQGSNLTNSAGLGLGCLQSGNSASAALMSQSSVLSLSQCQVSNNANGYRQPTPTELYDSGMERTLDGGRMDPRHCTPPHLSYNRSHALAEKKALFDKQARGSGGGNGSGLFNGDDDDDVSSVISDSGDITEEAQKIRANLNEAKDKLVAFVSGASAQQQLSASQAAQETLRDDPERLAKLEQTIGWAREVTRLWQESGGNNNNNNSGGNQSRSTTTVMIRNIPNRYSVSEVLEEIDARGFYKTYNYFYLPCDFGNKVSLGYAFLNFVSAQYVEKFVKDFSGTVLPKYCTNKVIDVVAAGKQGLNENVARFLRRDLKSRVQNPFFLPLIFGWSSRREWVAYPLSKSNLYKIETRNKEVSALASTEAKLKAIDEQQQQQQIQIQQRVNIINNTTSPTTTVNTHVTNGTIYTDHTTDNDEEHAISTSINTNNNTNTTTENVNVVTTNTNTSTTNINITTVNSSSIEETINCDITTVNGNEIIYEKEPGSSLTGTGGGTTTSQAASNSTMDACEAGGGGN